MEFIWKKLKFMCVLPLFMKLIKEISIKIIQRSERNVKKSHVVILSLRVQLIIYIY